jgi:hypothetical protein
MFREAAVATSLWDADVQDYPRSSVASEFATARIIDAGEPSLEQDPVGSVRTFPGVDSAPPGVAERARQAGLHAAMAIEKEEPKFLDERRVLLKKQMQAPLTKSEKGRLDFIRWNLARFEDARIGSKLDQLEAAVKRYNNFLSEITQLKKELDAHRSHR